MTSGTAVIDNGGQVSYADAVERWRVALIRKPPEQASSYGLGSYGRYSSGLCSYDLDSYGLYSYGLCSYV